MGKYSKLEGNLKLQILDFLASKVGVLNYFAFGRKWIQTALKSEAFNIRRINIEITLPNYQISDVLTVMEKEIRNEY